MKPIIVVSAVNFFEGGPLTILRDCLEYLSDNMSDKYRIIALVHDTKLLKVNNVEFVEYNKSRKNWVYRIYYEYVHFYFLSKRLKVRLWLSLHDITPNVEAEVRAVYCHNPSPFYSFSLHTFFYSYKIAIFSLLYKYLYKINIRKNDFVVVQASWIRDAFTRMYGVNNVVVAYPGVQQVSLPAAQAKPRQKTTFMYPAFPRVFKNFEVVAEAAKYLNDQGCSDFEVLLTINGEENKFSQHIVAKYKKVPTINFIGLQSREEIYSLYQQVSALIFSSKLETWGLPITEAKQFDIPILLADLPYARETVGTYNKVKFFNSDDHIQLAGYMKAFINGSLTFDEIQASSVQEPFAQNWHELFNILFNKVE